MWYIKLLTFIFLFSILSVIGLYAEQDHDLADQNDVVVYPEIKTCEEILLWCGSGCPEKDNFNPEKISSEDKQKFILNALDSYKERTDVFALETLKGYYYEKGDMPRSLYWAQEGAERGSGTCMGFLAFCYVEGKGVIQDYVEAVKWTYLAAAKEEETAKEALKALNKDLNQEDKKIIEQGKKKALEWMEKHLQVFLIHIDDLNSQHIHGRIFKAFRIVDIS